MTDNAVEIKIGAKIDSLTTEFARAKSSVSSSVENMAAKVQGAMTAIVDRMAGAALSVRESTTQMAEGTQRMAESIEATKSKLAGFGSALMAAFAVKEGLEFMDRWAEKAEKLRNTAEVLGLTTMQVQRLDAAAKLVGVPVENLHKSAGVLAKNMQAAAEGNKKMQEELAKVGVTTRDYKNLNFDEVLAKIADKTAGAKDGIEKMAVAKRLLGKAGTDLIPLLNQGSKGIKDMGDAAEKTGALMNDRMVKDGVRLQESMKKADMVVEGLRNTLADAFAPVLESVTDTMGTTGSGADTLGDIFKGLATVVSIAGSIIHAVYDVVKVIVGSLTTSIIGIVDALYSLAHFDWSGAKAAMVNASDGIKDNFKTTVDDMVGIVSKSADTMKKIWEGATPDKKDAKGSGGGADMDDDAGAASGKAQKDGKGDRLQQWQNELDNMRMATDAFHDLSTADEIAFWEKKLALVKHGTTEETAVMHTLLGLKKKAAVDGLTAQLNGIKEEMDAATQGSQERIDLAQKELTILAGTYGTDSNNYRAALKVKEGYVKDHEKAVIASQTEAIKAGEEGAIRMVEIDRDHYSYLEQAGQISSQKRFAIEAELVKQVADIKIAALEAEAALDNQTVAEKQRIANEIVAIKQGEAQTEQQISEAAALDSQQMWEGYFSTITQGFASTLQGMLNHTTTFKQGMAQIGQQLLSQFLSQEAKKLATFLAGQMGMTGANIAGNATRMASDKLASKQSIMETSQAAIKNIMTKAAEVFANVYNAIAGIPYVGPFLAPVMAVAATAAVIGYVGKVASAEQGWERVPEDGARAVLHKDEMVLPARVADSVRNMADGGSGGRGMEVHIHTIDSEGFARLLNDHGAELSAALQNHYANS